DKYVPLIEDLPRRAARWTTIAQIDIPADGLPLPVVTVSVKITSIFPGFDPIAPDAAMKRAKELMRPILRAGMAGNAHIHVDMEHYAIKDLTLQLVKELFAEDEFRDYPHFGVVLQAYLVDADRDVADMIAYAKQRGVPIWIRLVKGAYWDTETVIAEREHWPCPVWMQKWQSDACYERCARRLTENHQHIRTAFASHNIRSLAFAMALRDAHGAPPSAFELQMLFGMGDPIKQALADRGERCRVYTPYGDVLPGMAYLIRRLLENTANESFLRQGSDDDVSPDELLQDPETEYDPANPPPKPDWPCVALDEIQQCAPPRYFVNGVQREPFVNIADTDFSIVMSQDVVRAAIDEMRRKTADMSEVPLVIDGKGTKSPNVIASYNPSKPNEIVGRCSAADIAHVDNAVQAARTQRARWSVIPARRRSEILFQLANDLEAQRPEFVANLVLEVGKPWKDADGEVSEAIDYINFYARCVAEDAAFVTEVDVPGETNEHFYGPRGVVAVISPWNFSLALMVSGVAASFATGNAVIVKPSSQAPIIATHFAHLITAANEENFAITCLPGDGATIGDALVRHPGVDMVVFTGSRETGLAVNRAAAESAGPRGPKKVLLELGAKNAIIVDDDADLDEAVKGVLASAFGYAGQKCSAASRVIVVDKAHDRFMERFVEAAKSLRLGPAEEPTTSVPPVISKEAYDSIRAWIETGKREANCVLEVQPSEELKQSGGYYIGPVIFDDVAPDAQIAQQEIFGPVVAVIRAATFEEAVDIFNGTDYALTGGVYSRSPHNLDYARANCTCGNLYINRPIVGSHVGRQPFGGLRGSGDGARVGGVDYLKEFCVARTVSENTLRRGFAPSEEVAESIG
ncbi:MAG: bifunctional proline dehydrogenase/L-glutamate gamma-semialdehyde dehydrogenase, partial [Phycisphaerae bacterium]